MVLVQKELKNAYIGEYNEGGTLKSLSELSAMTSSNAEAELNTHPSDYYQKFNSEGKLVYLGGYDYLTNNGTQSGIVEWDNGYTIIGYESDQNMWFAMPA